MDLKEAIVSAFKNNADKKEMHYKEIALYIKTSIADFKDVDLEILEKRVNTRLANDLTKIVKGKKVENKESFFVPVSNGKKNKKGKFGRRAGIYALRTQKKTPAIIPIEQIKKKEKINANEVAANKKKPYQSINNSTIKLPIGGRQLPLFTTLTTAQIGKGGEFAVISELLFRGFNANTSVIDDGVDIICSKGNVLYLIQVKTTEYKSETFSISIKKSSFDRYNEKNTYYIVVLRYIIGKYDVPINQYLVFTANDIHKYIIKGYVSVGTNHSYILKFKFYNGDIFIFNGGKEDSVKFHLNNFDWIK